MSGANRKLERKQRAWRNAQRMLGQAQSAKADVIVAKLDQADRDKFVALYESPGYKQTVYKLAQVMGDWRRHNSTVYLEWHDVKGVMLSGDPGIEHVRKYLARNDAAANLIEYADEVTGREASLMQFQMALWALKWLE